MAEYEQFARGDGRRILIVDDDEAVLSGLSEYFMRLGYEVIRAPTGKQGLAGFESHDPEVTILDLRLPDIDGMQVLEIIRRKQALVILLTGYGDIPTAVRAMQLGAENFLTKPVDMPHLVATVERAIEKYDLRRENVRLRRMVPSTRHRVTQAVVVVVLVGAALLLGRWVGSAGSGQNTPPEIAPVRGSLQRSDRPQADSAPRLPGITPAAPEGRNPRR